MKHFLEVPTGEERNRALPEEFNYFGKLIGSRKIDYIDACTSRKRKGEWLFSRVLEGTAMQDVIVLPRFRVRNDAPRLQPELARLRYRLLLYGKNHAV